MSAHEEQRSNNHTPFRQCSCPPDRPGLNPKQHHQPKPPLPTPEYKTTSPCVPNHHPFLASPLPSIRAYKPPQAPNPQQPPTSPTTYGPNHAAAGQPPASQPNPHQNQEAADLKKERNVPQNILHPPLRPHSHPPLRPLRPPPNPLPLPRPDPPRHLRALPPILPPAAHRREIRRADRSHESQTRRRGRRSRA